MNRPGASVVRAAQSSGPGKLAPTQQLCWKYSVAERGSEFSSVYFSSPISPLRTIAMTRSSCSSSGGNAAAEPSVITNFSFGKRSNTPESSMCTKGRMP
jgi:hypothetical protein